VCIGSLARSAAYYANLRDYSFDPPIGRPVYHRLMEPNRQPSKTLDGRLCVIAYNDKQWTNFSRVAGREDLIDDPRFKTLTDRSLNLEACIRQRSL
jgi:crotonobetainyl-CoA:carnitine CoA-transferase CaiB-like acyl-CoA transferase